MADRLRERSNEIDRVVIDAAKAAAVLVLSTVMAGTVVAQVAPKSPTLCIDNDPDCVDNPVSSSSGIKWHPGHYMRLSDGDSQSSQFSHIDQIATESALRGVALRVYWYELEPSRGVYDFSKVDDYLEKLKKINSASRRPSGLPEFRLVLNLHERKFSSASPNGIVPNYILSDGAYNGGVAETKNGFVARLWEPAVMDRFIALWQALGKKYDAEPYLEAMTTAETTLGFGSVTPPSSYTKEGMHVQWRRLISAARAAAPRTNIVLNTNSLGTDEQMQATIDYVMGQRAAVGGPDILPGEILQSQRIWTGKVGGVDYRGKVAIIHSMDAAGLGGGQGNYTPKEVVDFAYSTLKVNYLMWARNTWAGTTAQQWNSGILPVIRAHPTLHSTCPTSYQSCMTD